MYEHIIIYYYKFKQLYNVEKEKKYDVITDEYCT